MNQSFLSSMVVFVLPPNFLLESLWVERERTEDGFKTNTNCMFTKITKMDPEPPLRAPACGPVASTDRATGFAVQALFLLPG